MCNRGSVGRLLGRYQVSHTTTRVVTCIHRIKLMALYRDIQIYTCRMYTCDTRCSSGAGFAALSPPAPLAPPARERPGRPPDAIVYTLYTEVCADHRSAVLYCVIPRNPSVVLGTPALDRVYVTDRTERPSQHPATVAPTVAPTRPRCAKRWRRRGVQSQSRNPTRAPLPAPGPCVRA